MPKYIHYCVLRTDTGEVVLMERSIVRACQALNVGTVWGGGLTPADAYQQAKQRLDTLNEAIARCPHWLDDVRIYQEAILSESPAGCVTQPIRSLSR